MRITILTRMVLAVACLPMSGCMGLPGKISAKVEETQSRASRLVKEVGRVDTSEKSTAPILHESGIWVGKNVVKLDQKDVLPPIFNEMTTFDRTVNSLSELAERITLRSNIPVKVTPDALAAAARSIQTTGSGATGAVSGSGGQSASPAAPVAATVTGAGTGPSTPIRITYSNGSFKSFLDTVAARLGVYWKYTNGTVQFFYTDTRSFQINAIPGDAQLTATVTSGSVSGGGGAGGNASGSAGGLNANNNQNTGVKSQLSVFTSIEKSISSMLSPYGAVFASPATGSITVTDIPDKLDRIAQFVETENRSLSRQVMINVTVLAVSVFDGDSFGINWNLVYGDLLHKYGIQNTLASDPNSTSFSSAILSSSNSKWGGTSMIVNALANQGKVRRETSASVVTLNNQPVPVQVAKQTSYLMSSQTTITANVGSSTTLNPGTITSGFNMTILPHILDGGTVLLQFSTDISALRRLRTVSSNGSSIESPELDTRNFLQRVAMKSSETLVISGFEQTDDNLDQQGVGRPTNFLFGGGYKVQMNKEVIVILVTPITMDGTSQDR